ncbi:MAG: FAD-dependent oxidoreductase [Eubacteriales bacterium]|nr:FAD-dependent oxidoreductase [Eubacteriales bacterium]
MQTLHVDIAVIGGSLGGTQAALAACRMGQTVYLCEATDWIGGQMTSQAVPPDEHPWIEQQGAPKSYLEYRKAVRRDYQEMTDASPLLKQQTVFCPGNSWVSRLAHDPRIAYKLLFGLLQPSLDKQRLKLAYHTVCVRAEMQSDRIDSVIVRNEESKEETRIVAKYYLDATDCGDLLPLTGIITNKGGGVSMNIAKQNKSQASPNIRKVRNNIPLFKTTTYHFDGRSFVVTPIFRQEGHETLGCILLKLMQTENA